MSCRRSSRFWGLGCPKIFHEIEDSLEDENIMKCVICKTGETAPGKVTVTLQRDEATVLIKDVLAEVCDNCGEYYLTE